MRTAAWILSGVLGLAALDAVVGTAGGAERFSGFLGGIANFIDRVLDPTISAIPNLTGTPTSSPN